MFDLAAVSAILVLLELFGTGADVEVLGKTAQNDVLSGYGGKESFVIDEGLVGSLMTCEICDPSPASCACYRSWALTGERRMSM